MTEPIGAPKLVRFALCNMFSACTHLNVNEEKVHFVTQKGSKKRLLLALDLTVQMSTEISTGDPF